MTAQKNGVVAINNLNSTWQANCRRTTGAIRSKCVETPTVIYVGVGYLVSISIVDTDDRIGYIYDAATTEKPEDASRIMATVAEIGVYSAGFRFEKGLMVVPGVGQAITLNYSVD